MKDAKTKYLEYLNSPEGAVKYNEFKNILYGKRDTLIQALFKIVYLKVKNKKEIDILDIGGGDGRRLRHLIDLFQKKKIAVKADLVEPSEEFIKNCIRESAKGKYPINSEKNTLEKFSTKKKYDIIFLIHSIYTFRSNAYLAKIKRMLKEDGVAIFITNAKNSLLGGLKKIMDARYNSSRNDIESLLGGLGEYQCEIKMFDTKFSGVLTKSQLNKKGNLILEWIGMDSLENVPSEIKEEARKFFVRRTKKDGRIWEKEVVVMTRFKKKICKHLVKVI